MIRHRPARVPTVTVPAAELERLQRYSGDLEVELARERARCRTALEGSEKWCHIQAERHAICFRALRDAIAFYDRVSSSRTEWTAADVKRLEEIRKLVS
jgi:hypothetical protein